MALKKTKPRPRPRAIKGVTLTAEPLKVEKLLDVGTQARLAQFCLAHHGADPRVVIHKAIEDFIEHDLSDNVGVSTEYKGAKS